MELLRGLNEIIMLRALYGTWQRVLNNLVAIILEMVAENV